MSQASISKILTVIFSLPLAGLDAADDAFQPIGGTAFDRAAFTQWVDGRESPFTEAEARGGPNAVVWTSTTRPEYQGVKFGAGRVSGIRHLRIGFSDDIGAGSVLVRGGGGLSVLKADAVFPGNVADDSQWIPAERLVDGKPSRMAVGPEGYALWVLPADTKTRALRFSHTPNPGDSEMAGWLGGVSETQRVA